MNKLKAIWKIEELRGKILVTLLLLLAFRLGCCLPVPFVSNTALDAMFSNNSIFGYMNMLSGGALSRSAFFALGVSRISTHPSLRSCCVWRFPAGKPCRRKRPARINWMNTRSESPLHGSCDECRVLFRSPQLRCLEVHGW